jgi:ribosomal silencing factor RsfS
LWTLVIDLGKIMIPRLRVAGILWTLVIDLGKIIIHHQCPQYTSFS